MATKLSNAARGSFRGLIWLLVLAVALSISAYSLYYVARTLGVPKLFAAGFSTAYDGVALIAADKSLQFAQEGKSGAFPRMVMVVFAGLSAFLNSLHAIFGGESPLAIPMWAGLPLAAVAAFEIHTAQARAKASARTGHAYPAPLPKYGGWGWTLFPLKTLSGLRDIVIARIRAVSCTELALAAVPARSAREANGAGSAEPHALSARTERPERARTERTAAPEEPHEDAAGTASGASAGDTHASEPEANVSGARPMAAIRTCALASCARTFVPARKDARYCSGKCRAAASRAARAEKTG
jgi:hypothetical protein